MAERPVGETTVEAARDAIFAFYKNQPDCKACGNTGEECNWLTGEWGPCSVHPDYEEGMARAVLDAAIAKGGVVPAAEVERLRGALRGLLTEADAWYKYAPEGHGPFLAARERARAALGGQSASETPEGK